MTERKKSYTLFTIIKTFDREKYPFETFQRAAGGGIAVMGSLENGPVRANRNHLQSGSRGDVAARYSRACMSVHGREHSLE
mgnify:CR=1 FL=1